MAHRSAPALAGALLFVLSTLTPGTAAAQFVCAGFEPEDTPAGVAAKTAGAVARKLSPRGTVNVLVVFAQFADQASRGSEIPSWAPALFDPAVPGSLSHYYQTVSQGQLQIRGTVLPRRFTSDEPASAYLSAVSTEQGEYGRFVRQVLAQVDREIDLGEYDNDGPDGVSNSGDDDGYVDYLCLCLRSVPRNFLIGSATGIARLTPDVPWHSEDRGTSGGTILVSPTGHGALLAESGMPQTVGAMAHEFGHGLGLPDLYDTSFLGLAAQDPTEDSAGIGAWGLMGWGAQGWQGDDGPNPPCAWSLEQLGWIGQDNDRLVEIEADTTGLVVADLYQGGRIYKVPLPPEAPPEDGGVGVIQGYLLLEQRVRGASFYNRHLPAEGLLVWRIRPRSGDNSEEEAKLVDLVCADGLYADAGYPLGRTADRFAGRDNLDFWAHDGAYVAAHGGNQGDATDPFDGVRHTRLNLTTNPATTTDPLLAEATTGTALTRIRRQGEATAVDVTLPRWAGTIRGQARWTGEILVDGDLTVAPGGSLVAYAGTQVRFAGTDRLASGIDPALCELRLEGDFEIVTSFSARYGGQEVVPAVFAAERPGERWYGIELDPGQTGEILVPEESLVLRDAVQGLVMPGAPAGSFGLALGQMQIEDAVTTRTAGNGDGRLDPGETFALAVPVANWSLTPYPSIRVRTGWRTSLVSQDGQGGGWLVLSSEVRSLYPGSQQLFHLSPLTLSPEATAGETLRVEVQVVAGSAIPSAAILSLVVGGSYPRHAARLELAGSIARDQVSLVWADQPTTVEALVEGEIAAAELLVQTLPDGAPLRTEPMTLAEIANGTRRFTAPFRPAPGQYLLGLRVRGANGATVFSPTSRTVWAVSPPATHPTLVLVGDGFAATVRESFGQDVDRLTGAASIAELSAATEPLLEPLLAEYHDAGDLVVWAGALMGLSTQAALAAYLEQGGKLLLASAVLPTSPGFVTRLRPFLPCRTVGAAKSGTVHSLYDSTAPGSQYQARYQPLDLISPATPLLQDPEGKAVGLRADQGASRVVYLAVDLLGAVPQPVPVARQGLLATGLELLRRPWAPAMVLEVPGRTASDSLVLLPVGKADRVRVAVAGSVAGAELVVRALPYLTPVLRVPMTAEPSQGDTHAFAAGFELASPGRYRLSVDLTGPDHERLLTPDYLQLWQPFHTPRPALLLAQAVYTTAEEAGLRTLFGAALPREGVDVMTEKLSDEAWYDLLLEEYLGPGKVVAWNGVSMSERQLTAFRRFLEQGGRLLLTSRMFHRYTPGGESFLQEILGVVRVPTLGYGRLHTPDGTIELTVQYSALELLAPARPLLLDEAGKTAAMYLDNGAWRVCYLPFDLQRVGSYAAQPLLETCLGLLRAAAPETAILPLTPVQEDSVLEVGAVFAQVPLPTESSLGNGAGLFDYDGDDDLDLYLVRLGAANQLWRNDGAGFTEQAEEAGVAVVERGRGLAIGDSDGDGDLDLYLVNEGRSRFLRNQGDGTFAEATAQLTPGATADSSLDHRGSGRSAGFFDLDRDGDLDLFVVNALGTNRLYCNDDGRFTEQAGTYGLASPGDGRGLAIGDWDGDGDPDLFVANTDGTSHLFRNEVTTAGRFVEATQELGLTFTGGEVAALFGDYDNDGDPDLFLSNERGEGRLWRNQAGVAFVPAHPAGGAPLGARTVGAAWVDYDNDGDLDLAVTGIDARAGGDQLYQNRGDGQFLSVGARVGLQAESAGRAVVGADYDQDGRQDLVVADYAGSRLYRNLTAPDHWLQLDLGGASGNLNGLGAQVTLTVQGERQYREVQSGFGYGSQMQPRVSFGLGEATRVDSVQVTWPDGARRSWLNLGVDQRLLLAYPNPSTAVSAGESALPTDLSLAQNHPNPFNAATVLPYRLPRQTRVEVAVFDVTGQRVRILVDQVQPSGEYRLIWDGRDENGRAAASGVYLCRLTAGADRRTRRLVLLR